MCSVLLRTSQTEETIMSVVVRPDFFGSIPDETRYRVLELLEASGICVHTGDEAAAGTPGLAIFDTDNEQLRAMLHHCSRTSAALALSVAPRILDRSTLWSLIEAGAFDVVQWPSLPDRADDVLRRLQRRQRVDQLVDSQHVATKAVGANPEWRRLVRSVVEAAAFTTCSVLITGESGTGKEQLAHLIHDLDPRPEKGDFVIVDCTTLSPELSGSELFGHERGAFTGAMTARDGAFALAHRGTLFLDEVGELRSELQAQLLRAVHERRY